LAWLCARRWSVEAFFGNIEQATKMDVLRYQFLKMIHKEIHLHFIANKLIRRYDSLLFVEYLSYLITFRIRYRG